MAGADELKRRMAERLKGWKLLPNGDIAHAPFIGSAVFPMASGVALALRFEARRTGPNDRTPEQLQLGLTPLQCREMAAQLLEGAAFLEKEMTPPAERPN
jgi:hypothetical protein